MGGRGFKSRSGQTFKHLLLKYICMYVCMYVCVYVYLLKRGAEVSEKERIDRAELKRSVRKGNMSVLPDDVKSWKCEICVRILLSKAGYVNHKKSHKKDVMDMQTCYLHDLLILPVLYARRSARQQLA